MQWIITLDVWVFLCLLIFKLKFIQKMVKLHNKVEIQSKKKYILISKKTYEILEFLKTPMLNSLASKHS